MIIIRLMGGLGNQMFQYAFAYVLSKKNKSLVKIDTTLLDDRLSPHEIVTHRELLLNKVFNVSLDFASKNDIEYFNGKTYNNLIGKSFNKIRQAIRSPSLVIEENRGFNPRYLNLKDDTCLVGSFQSEKYFYSDSQAIKNVFKFKYPIMDISHELVDSLKSENSVAIHFRRGDYVTSPLYSKKIGALALSYYIKAIDFIIEKVDNPVFYVFSDDINWCKENLKVDHLSFYFVNDEHAGIYASNYLQLLTKCKYYIISNSTFSWWGAWLSENNSNKIVVAPEQWFIEESLNDIDIVPENWIKL